MPNCCVYSCRMNTKTFNARNSNITYHLFPKDEYTKQKWTLACANPFGWTPSYFSKICSEHFDISCFVKAAYNKRKIKDGAVPTLKLPKGQPSIVSKSSYYKIVFNEKPLNMNQPTNQSENQRWISSADAQLPSNVSESGTCTSTSTYNAPFQDLAKITKLENYSSNIPGVVDPPEVSKLEPSHTQSLDIASITKLENQCLTPPTAQLVDSWESGTTASLSTHNIQSQEEIDMDLKKRLLMKDSKISRLQKQNIYLKRKLAKLQKQLKDIKEDKDKEDRLLICKVCVKVMTKKKKQPQSKENEE